MGQQSSKQGRQLAKQITQTVPNPVKSVPLPDKKPLEAAQIEENMRLFQDSIKSKQDQINPNNPMLDILQQRQRMDELKLIPKSQRQFEWTMDEIKHALQHKMEHPEKPLDQLSAELQVDAQKLKILFTYWNLPMALKKTDNIVDTVWVSDLKKFRAQEAESQQ